MKPSDNDVRIPVAVDITRRDGSPHLIAGKNAIELEPIDAVEKIAQAGGNRRARSPGSAGFSRHPSINHVDGSGVEVSSGRCIGHPDDEIGSAVAVDVGRSKKRPKTIAQGPWSDRTG